MVKPVFKTLNEMRAASSAADAYDIGVAFLHSADAANVDDGRAGTFAKELAPIFSKYGAWNLYATLLHEGNSPDSKASQGLKTSLGFALTDHKALMATRVDALIHTPNNAQILAGVRAAEKAADEGTKIMKAGKGGVQSTFGDSADPSFPEIRAARDAHFLKLAVNDTLLENDVTDAQAADFMHVLGVAFRRTGTTPEQQIELLDFIATGVSERDALYVLAVDKAVEITGKIESALSRTTPTGGQDMIRKPAEY